MKELHVDGIQKSFGLNRILSDVYLSCKPGEIVGLLGRNGCGKSTLMKVICGAVRAENRFVRVDGAVVLGVRDTSQWIGYVPQHHFLPDHLTLQQMVNLYSDAAYERYLLEHPVLKPIMGQKCRTLSGGEQRIFEILLVACSSVSYVLIDEPFNGLSPQQCEETKALIVKLSAHKGFIVTDHAHEHVLDLASKLMLLHDGVIRPIANRGELVEGGYLVC